jgi:hypothetical protein
MRTFFYSIKKSNCGAHCHWQVCPQRYLAQLKTMKALRNIRPLFGKLSSLSPLLTTSPRNGDIIILYAENAEHIDTMIATRDGFDGLKKILVVADSAGVDGDKYHMLAPRFITQAERNMDELEAVIKKMKRQTH